MEPHKSSPHTPILVPSDPLYIYPSIPLCALTFQLSHSFMSFDQNSVYTYLLSYVGYMSLPTTPLHLTILITQAEQHIV